MSNNNSAETGSTWNSRPFVFHVDRYRSQRSLEIFKEHINNMFILRTGIAKIRMKTPKKV
jgi:hypothetical protein